MYAVALALGLRQGEALGLRWRDVDLATGTLKVNVVLQWISSDNPKLVEPKTWQSHHTLPIPDPLVAHLKVHRSRQKEERLLAGQRWQGEK